MRIRTVFVSVCLTLCFLAVSAATLYKSAGVAAMNDAQVSSILKQYTADGFVINSESEFQYRCLMPTSGNAPWGYCQIKLQKPGVRTEPVIIAYISWNAETRGFFCTGCTVSNQ